MFVTCSHMFQEICFETVIENHHEPVTFDMFGINQTSENALLAAKKQGNPQALFFF